MRERIFWLASKINNKLLCIACQEELSVQSSIVHKHFQSAKDAEGLDNKEARERGIAEALKVYNTDNH